MNIEKLKELSGLRLSNYENYQNLKNKQKQIEELKQTILSIENQIQELRDNATYGNDHFDLIDKLEIRKDEIEKTLKIMEQERYTVVPCNEYDDIEWDLSLNEYVDYIELLGIVDLMKDSSYTENLMQNSVEFGIPELNDALFTPKLANIVKTTNIDADILASDIIGSSYYKPEIIVKYINRLINITKSTPVDNMEAYKQINRKFLSICSDIGNSNYEPNIFDDVCSIYGEELGFEFLNSLIGDEFYNQIDPGYAIACFIENQDVLVDNENGKIKSPQKIYASLIKAYNSDLEENEHKIEISDFEKTEYNSIDEKLIFSINRITEPGFNITDEEINQIVNVEKKI